MDLSAQGLSRKHNERFIIMTPTQKTLETLARRFGVSASDLNYLIHYDPDRNIAYFETPKVACTSIKKYMQDKVFGVSQEFETKGQVHDRGASPIRPLVEHSPEEVMAVLSGRVRRFSFVRNPYSRILSGYLDKIVTNQWERDRHLPMLGFDPNDTPGFLAFLQALAQIPEGARDIHFALQSRLLLAGDVGYEFMGRFERFDQDFAHLKAVFYQDNTDDNYAAFGKHHASDANDKITAHFGAEERAIVEEIYGPDFRIFGYATDIEKASEPPQFPEHSLRRGLGNLLTRLGLPTFDPANTEGFLRTVENEMARGKLDVLQATALMLFGAENAGDLPAQTLHRRAIAVLHDKGFPKRAADEETRFAKRFSQG